MYDYYDEEYLEKSKADEIIEKAIYDVADLIKVDVNNQIKEIIQNEKTYDDRINKLKQREIEVFKKENMLKQAEKELEINFQKKLKEEKFSEVFKCLMPENHILYGVDYRYKEADKCNLCDEKRKLSYKMPSGKEFFVDCECSKQIFEYYIQKFKAYMIKTHHNSRCNELQVVNIFIEPSRYDDELKIKLLNIKEKYKESDDKYDSYYKTESEAQKLVDRLNKES